jgi:hypothetical protein
VRQTVEHFGDDLLPAVAYEEAIKRRPALLAHRAEQLIENIDTVYSGFAERGLKLSSYLKAAAGGAAFVLGVRQCEPDHWDV